jgi:hypothetical protein
MVVEDRQELVQMGPYLGHAESRHELPPLLSGQLLLRVLSLSKKKKKYCGQVSNTISAHNFTFY